MRDYNDFEIWVIVKNEENNIVSAPRPKFLREIRDKIGEISGQSPYVNDYKSLHLKEVKWNGYEEDMLKISLHFPNCIFTVFGDGEETHDIWEHVFFNGKHKRKEGRFIIEEITLGELE